VTATQRKDTGHGNKVDYVRFQPDAADRRRRFLALRFAVQDVSHSRSFDQRRRPETFLIAIMTAFF
jgi:hypothetical protein